MDNLTTEQKIEIAKIATELTIGIVNSKRGPVIRVDESSRADIREPLLLFSRVYNKLVNDITPDQTPL